MSKASKKSKKQTVAPAVAVAPKQTAATQPQQPSQTEIDAINAKLAQVGNQVRFAIDNAQFALAKNLLESEILPHAPQHPLALNDLALCEKSLGNFEVAYQTAIFALNFAAEQHLAEIYDNLTSICHKLNRFEESKHFARLAILVKKDAVKHIAPQELPKRKKKGIATEKSKNIIAFSLSGADPRQCETAVLNASLASQIYPNWTCRFYVDETVPAHVFDRLSQHSVQLFHCELDTGIPAIFRHFAVASDKEVQAFLLRDVDSLLSYKEAAAVEAWIDSKQFFHIMRDFYEHTELVLPSMWGGYTGAFENIEDTMRAFFAQNGVSRLSLLGFLREYIFPTIAQSLMTHDDLHLDPDSYAYPRFVLSDVEKIPFFHIGIADGFIRTTSIHLEEAVNEIEWYIANQQDQIVCFYRGVPVLVDGKPTVHINLPSFYNEHLASGRWQIRYRTIS